MRNSYFIIVVFTILTSSFCSNVQAQKQGRVERLYEFIARSDSDKYTRLRERLDSKSATTYKNEITLADALEKLLLAPSFNAIEPYLKSSMTIQQQDGGARVRAFCKDVNLDFNTFLHKADSTIFALLSASQEQLKDSRILLAQISEYKYNIDPDVYLAIIHLKERVQFADLQAAPDQAKCKSYFQDFNKAYNYAEVVKIYNDLLYKQACSMKNDSTILAYFNDSTLKVFYANSKEARPYLTDVQKIYDDYLFEAIRKATSPEIQKSCINAYINCPYLSGCPRKYLSEVDYTNDSIDLVILITRVDSSARLPLVKTYLQTHKYKTFRDKAQQLRNRFIDSMIWNAPNITKYYKGDKITRETRTANDTLVTTTYKYTPQGNLSQIIQSTELKKDATAMHPSPLKVIVTTFKYNNSGKCYEEETVDTLSNKTLCQVSYQYDITGHPVMKNTKWSNGKNNMDYYNNNGQITRTQEYQNGQIRAQTDCTYDANGRISRKTWVNTRPDTNQPVMKETSEYTYNPFGYLTNISYTKENMQNENISGTLTIVYDELGNQINPNYQYTYDQTGAWITKTNKANPADTEKITYIYK